MKLSDLLAIGPILNESQGFKYVVICTNDSIHLYKLEDFAYRKDGETEVDVEDCTLNELMERADEYLESYLYDEGEAANG